MADLIFPMGFKTPEQHIGALVRQIEPTIQNPMHDLVTATVGALYYALTEYYCVDPRKIVPSAKVKGDLGLSDPQYLEFVGVANATMPQTMSTDPSITELAQQMYSKSTQNSHLLV